MIPCSYCGRNIPDDGTFCPYCGNRRRVLRTNYDLPTNTSNEIYKTSGTISTYIATGSIAVAESQQHPGSPSLSMGARDYLVYSPRIPDDFSQGIREGEEGIRNYNIELERRERATAILSILGIDNLIFDSKMQARLFREDILRATTELYNPCERENDFTAKLASLASLFDVPLPPLRRLVPQANPQWRHIVRMSARPTLAVRRATRSSSATGSARRAR